MTCHLLNTHTPWRTQRHRQRELTQHLQVCTSGMCYTHRWQHYGEYFHLKWCWKLQTSIVLSCYCLSIQDIYFFLILLFFPLARVKLCSYVLIYTDIRVKLCLMWIQETKNREDLEHIWVKPRNDFVPLCLKSLLQIVTWYWYPGLYLACREHPLILLGFSLCIANISP